MFRGKSLVSALIVSCIICVIACAQAMAQSTSQDPQTNQTQTDDQKKAQAALEEKALRLIDQVVAEAQSLKLPENRIRVDFTAGDMLWAKDETRARMLFADAATNIAQMIAAIDTNDRRQFASVQVITRIRQEFLTIVAQHDAKLAQELLNQTRFPQPDQQQPQQQNNPFMRRGDPDVNMEFQLLAQVAASDPQQALANAQQMLEKGDYSNALINVLTQLQTKDSSSADKLASKIVSKLSSEDLVTNGSARNLAISILSPGPMPPQDKDNPNPTPPAQGQVLNQSTYTTLITAVVNQAVNVTVPPPQPAGQQQRGGRGGPGGGPGGGRFNDPGVMYLASLQSLLSQIDKYAPNNATALHQKLAQAGFSGTQQSNMRAQINALTQNASADTIMSAAASAPPGMQNRLYQQAAFKALESGDTDKATQIANQHLSTDTKTQVLQAIETQQVVNAATQGKTDAVQALLGKMQSDDDRINALIQIANAVAQKGDLKTAQLLLDQAKPMVSHRAANYEQLQEQLKVAEAYAAVDPTQSFKVMEPGINQLNEMVYAASILNGFEVDIMKQDELPMQQGSTLSNTVAAFSKELGALAKVDFDGAQATAEKFQQPETRLMSKLSVARGVLGGSDPNVGPNGPNNRRNGQFGGPGGRRGGNQ
ncbi:MAG TPA: hypothetical protein VFC63_26890 [Blastocatellia bacterium]|nr:hypothetical protein [Blastocatellia bacterium]